jgi:hypothetical protein
VSCKDDARRPETRRQPQGPKHNSQQDLSIDHGLALHAFGVFNHSLRSRVSGGCPRCIHVHARHFATGAAPGTNR